MTVHDSPFNHPRGVASDKLSNTKEFTTTTGADDTAALLDELATEFLARRKNGEKVTIENYQKLHPSIAKDIAEVFSALLHLEGLKKNCHSSGLSRAVVGLPALEQLGDFRILREIGRGGMGVVFEAEQISLRRHVALKILGANVATKPGDFARFRREAESAARLHHTHIVPVYGTGEELGVHYYAMQHIDGWPLAEVIEQLGLHQNKQLPIDPVLERLLSPINAARAVADLADAIAFAHEQGVIHRDIKPSNVLLDRNGSVWLVDFGLAIAQQDHRHTGSGRLTGTMQYMAPEQFGGKFQEQSDVYSLGLTLYELLALKPAYGEANHIRLIQQKSTEPPPSLRMVAPHVPRDLVTIVTKACSVSISHRYATASDFADDLKRFIAGEPIKARRTSWFELTGRWIRKHKAIAVTSGVAAMLLSVLLGFLAVSNRKLEQVVSELRQEKQLTQNNLNIAVHAMDEIAENVSARGMGRTFRMDSSANGTNWDDVVVSDADSELLQSLLTFYEEFAKSNHVNLDAETAVTERRIGDIEIRLGKLEKAIASYSRAVAYYQALLAENPKDETLLVGQAAALNPLGGAYAHAGKIAQAVDANFQAMRTLRDVANPSTTTELELAKSYILLANVARTAGVRELVAAIEATGGLDLALTARPRLTPREGDWGGRPPPPQSTLQYLEDASRILKKQIAANPSDAELRLLLAKCELDLSDYTHLFAQALALPIELKSSENAERIVRQLVQEESSSLHRQFELAEMLIARTRIEGELNEDSAIAHLREATAICEKLVATVPRNPEFRVLLGRSKHLMAVRLKEMGELQESSIAMQEALEIYRELSEESPTSSFFQISRAQLLLEWAIWQEEQGDSVGGRATLQKSLEVAQKAAPAWGNTGIFADFLAKLKQKVAGANR